MNSIITLFNNLLLYSVATPVIPKVKGTPQLIANVTDPSVTRDSCGSVKLGSRALWVCRDTQQYSSTTGKPHLPIIPNTASWTNFNDDGTPAIVNNAPVGAASSGSNPVLRMYGGNVTSYPSFYPVQADECPPSGICHNGTRYAIWPASPPMIAENSTDTITAYTWISKNYIESLQTLITNQAHSLYKFTYDPSSANDSVPSTSVVNEEFWQQGEWGYGQYGNVVMNGTAYLYAQNENKTAVALAKVPVTGIEDRSQYQYYVDGQWTTAMPALTDNAASISNFETALQGNFYYSEPFSNFIWIGPNGNGTGVEFSLTTVPAPEGPWIEPYVIHTGESGDGFIGTYSLQANPALLSSP